MPAAVVVARQSKRIGLLDAAYAVPVAFVLGLLAVGMARRAKRNLAWLRLDGGGTRAASAGVVLGVLAVSLALTAALSVGFYEAIHYYQSRH
jgi:predicted anti-sigma-YlaC factor YlaD